MSAITAHVLDTSRGKPAASLAVTLERQQLDASFTRLAQAQTDADGRVSGLLGVGALSPGVYRLTFATAAYFEAQGLPVFYPRVEILFQVLDPSEHYHIPLLLSPYGYSTYRGS